MMTAVRPREELLSPIRRELRVGTGQISEGSRALSYIFPFCSVQFASPEAGYPVGPQ